MGQKTHPTGLRLGIVKTWNSNWYAEGKFADLLYEDKVLRRYLFKRFEHASLALIGIERTAKKVIVNIHTARPGIVIGRRGEEVERLKGELQYLTGKEIYINIREIKRPETNAKLVAENIARQLEKRIAFRRAMKKAIASAMRLGCEGIKIKSLISAVKRSFGILVKEMLNPASNPHLNKRLLLTKGIIFPGSKSELNESKSTQSSISFPASTLSPIRLLSRSALKLNTSFSVNPSAIFLTLPPSVVQPIFTSRVPSWGLPNRSYISFTAKDTLLLFFE